MQTHTIETKTLARPVWPTPLIIVSDLHISGLGGHNQFQRDLFCEYLERVGELGARLVVAGDIRDLTEEYRARALYEQDWQTWWAARTRGQVVVELPGNHDRLERVVGIRDRIDIADFFCWHGDALDPACNRHGIRGHLDIVGSFVWSGIERAGLRRPLGFLKRLAQKTAAARGETNRVWLEDAEHRGKVLYCCGHTHKPGLDEWATGHVFANCGSWVEEGVGWAVEVEGRKVDLVKVTA